MSNYIEKIAMNIVYQLDDDANLPVEFRQANNDKRIDFVIKLIKQALQEQEERIIEEEYQRRKRVRSKTAEANYVAGYNEAKQEMKEKLMQIVIEDVPHKYQERLLKELNI